MRKALALLGGLALGAWLARALRRRPSEPAALEPGPDPRAEELRDKLADARTIVAEREEFEEAETPVDEAEPAGEDVAERRRKVHAHGHAVAGEMRRRAKPKPKTKTEE